MKLVSVGLGLLTGLGMLVQSGGALLLPWAEEFLALADLEQGRWALAFAMVPSCPACEQVVSRLGPAAEAFPEIQFGARLKDEQAPTQILGCLLESVTTQCVEFKRLINIWYERCEYKCRCVPRGYPLGYDVVYEYQYELWCQLWLYLCGKIRVTPLGKPWLAKSWKEYDWYTGCGCTAEEPVPLQCEGER